MKNHYLIRKISLFFAVFLFSIFSNSLLGQTVSGPGGAIPDNNTSICFPLEVSLGNTVMDETYGLEQVCVSFNHTWVSDLVLYMFTPSNTFIQLQGGDGGTSNFNGTICYTMAGAPTSTWNGVSSTSLSPEYPLGSANNGQTSTGNWQICAIDQVAGDAGGITNISLEFGSSHLTSAPPTAVLGDACTWESCSPITVYDDGGPGFAYYDGGGSGITWEREFCTDVPGSCISITFNNFEIEDNGVGGCYDYVEVYDGGVWVDGFCGTGGPRTVTATSGCLSLLMFSDGTISEGGFDATVNCVPGGCAPFARPVHDDCAGAIPLAGFGDNANATGCDLDAPDPWGAPCGWMSTENSLFYTFEVLPTSTQPIEIEVIDVACVGGANTLQMAMFDYDCASIGTYSSGNFHGCTAGTGAVTLTASTNPMAPGTYLLAVDGNAGADCTWEFVSELLAVEWLDLWAEYQARDHTSKIKWSTVSETDNRGFYIQRSENKINWKDLAFQEGAGNNGSMKNYSYTDTDLPSGVQEVFYRIKQEDFNGKTTYSNQVLMEIPSLLRDELISVFPNPVKDVLNIQLGLSTDEALKLEIFTPSGKKVFSKAYGARPAGYHTLVAHPKGLSSGIYLYRISGGQSDFEGKIIVHN